MCMDVDLLLASFFTHHHLFNVYQDAFRAEQSASPTYYPTLSPTFWPTYYPTLSPIDQNDSDESETIAPTEEFLAEESMSIEASISMNTEVVSVLYCEMQSLICRVTHPIRRILQFNYRIYLAF